EVSVDQAQAVTYGRNRRVTRRRLRRGAALTPLAAVLSPPWAYRRAGYAAPGGYYYGAPSYYYGARSYYYGAPYYAPSYFGRRYWRGVSEGLCAPAIARTVRISEVIA